MIFLLIFLATVSYGHPQSTTEDVTYEPTTVTTNLPIYYLSDYEPDVTWKPQSDDFVIIEADDGYKITVNVTDCDIDGDSGDYATITTDGLTQELIFTYDVKRHPAYLYNTHRLLANFYGTNASNFTVIFSRVGERRTTTTTEIPTTTVFLPTPSVNDAFRLLVYLDGKAPKEYNETFVEQLRDSIVRMATEYCDNENFPLNGTITSSNVIIHQLGHCPLNWPDTETCARLNFSVPVNLMEDSDSPWTGYQLNSDHLRIMWERYAYSELPDGITYYYFDRDMSSTKWGILIAGGVMIVFVLSMVLVRYCCSRVSNNLRRRKLSDTTSIISTSDRNSQTSLPPHYLQETPPLFENAYPMYNPDKGTSYSEPTYTKSHEYEDYPNLNLEINKQPDDEQEESGA